MGIGKSWYLTPLNALQRHLLELLGFSPEIYHRLLSPTAKNGMKLIDQRSPFSFNRSSPHRLPVQCLHREEDRSSNTALLCAAHVHTLSYSIRAFYPYRNTLPDADVIL